MKLTYKIIAAVLSLLVIVVLVAAPLVYVGMESLAAQLLVTIGQAAGNETAQQIVNDKGQIPDHIGIDISVAGLLSDESEELTELVKVFSKGDNTENTKKVLKPVIAPFFVFVTVLVFLAICSIVTAVLAFVVKDNRKVIGASITGIFLSLMAPESFEAVAIPFTDGTITLSKLAGSSWITLLGDIDKVELTSVFWFVPVAFAAVILWTLLYNYTLPADEKKKRLEMIGEAEEK